MISCRVYFMTLCAPNFSEIGLNLAGTPSVTEKLYGNPDRCHTSNEGYTDQLAHRSKLSVDSGSGSLDAQVRTIFC